MGSSFGKAFVIANALAGKGAVGRDPKRFEQLLSEAGLEFELSLTERPRHAVELARRAIDEGYSYLVAVGGDGTVHEVVNGMMGESAPRNPEAVLGVVSAGSGSDFIRTFGLPDDPAHAIEHLKGDGLFPIDLGRVTFHRDGGQETRYFPNIAEAGLGAEVVRRAARLPRKLGQVRYLIGFWMTLGPFKPVQGRVVCDKRTHEGRITNLVVANCQFFGGGMRVAPKAHPNDGRFDVLIQIGRKRDYISALTKVYRGDHIPSPVIKEYYAKRVEVTTDHPLRVEADGELLGLTPATFEIVPNALRLKI
ncbi:MAG: diacylglycerol/lipid kinase family protein [Actinomycetota bacterium]